MKAKAKRKRRKRKPKKEKPIKQRKTLVATPQVHSFKDFHSNGVIRVLQRTSDSFPEFALYPKRAVSLFSKRTIIKSLNDAGFTDEGKGKWVLRTNKFNVFVYV